jgi:hypothetical protein
MKKKNLISITAACVLFLSFMGVAAFSVDYGPSGPSTIIVDDTTKATDRYLGINFKHEYHNKDLGITCVTCHHTEKADFVSGTPAARCEACHKADAEITFKDAMHKNCVICHINKTAEGKTPPTECLGCHTQRK